MEQKTGGAEAAPQDVAQANGGLGFLTREDILGADDIRVEVVEVPEWTRDGRGKVRVKGMNGKERDEFESELVQNKGKKNQFTDTRNVRAKLAARCMVDDKNKAMFTAADVARLGEKSSVALDRVFKVGMKLSKLTQEDLEEMTGNSEPDRSEDS